MEIVTTLFELLLCKAFMNDLLLAAGMASALLRRLALGCVALVDCSRFGDAGLLWLQLRNVINSATCMATHHLFDAFEVTLPGAPFIDAYRCVDWILTASPPLLELVLVMEFVESA